MADPGPWKMQPDSEKEEHTHLSQSALGSSINFKSLGWTQGVAVHCVFPPRPSGPKQPSSGTWVCISSALPDKSGEPAPLEIKV